MVSRVMLVRLSLLMVELTSLPLIVIASIYLLSGYQMLTADVRVIPEPRRIHTDKSLRILAIFLAYLHALGGAVTVVERRLRDKTLKAIFEVAAFVIATSLLIFLLTLEATL
ncbi:MAG: hypothetical protein N3E47_05415 [Candidatus Bathyarchaeota archaeon]|nr:hypothetical protein [Candidatus Bathyarchaeota archaeon]